MKLEQSFEVAAPLERVWEALIDVERVAPCLPGASVTGRSDDGSYTGEFKVKIGPTSAAYSGKLHMETVDADAHSATMQAAGTDKRGQGGAKATIVSSVAPAGEGRTKVDVSTDYHITGRLARFGRGGMIEEISNRLLGDFATNLQTMLAGEGDAPAAPAAAEATEASPAPTEAATAAMGDGAAAQGSEATDEAAPDATIEGATPVAEALAEEPATPDPAPAGAQATPGATANGSFVQGAPAPESEPISALSLVGGVAVKRVRENPIPLLALLVGFLIALRVFRRRS